MTSIISILGVPALVMFGNENVPMAGQVAVMSTALAGTGTSTLLLSLCVSPYVFRMAEVKTFTSTICGVLDILYLAAVSRLVLYVEHDSYACGRYDSYFFAKNHSCAV